MSGVGANVLAADGREASRVHADCSLHQHWTSAHEWEYCPLRRGGRGGKNHSATEHRWWKIQGSLLPGVLVLQLFSWVLPCRIASGEVSAVDLTEQLAPNRDLVPTVSSGDFHVEIRTLILIHLFCPWRRFRRRRRQLKYYTGDKVKEPTTAHLANESRCNGPHAKFKITAWERDESILFVCTCPWNFWKYLFVDIFWK